MCSFLSYKIYKKGKRRAAVILLLAVTFLSCQSNAPDFEREVGQVAAFAEMVVAGVKPLALSAPLPPAEMDDFEPLAREAAAAYGVAVFRESDLIQTDLFPTDVAAGKDVLLLCDTLTKRAYDSLRADRGMLVAADAYTGAARRQIARRFGRLLGYTPQGINRLLAEQTDFRTLADFGVNATNLFWYYRDRMAAKEFYTTILGLKVVAEYDNSTILQIAQDAYLTLVDDGKGMHTADEPKSVALALLTRQLPQWWNYLEEQSVNVKYTYKPREGNAHDGFVIVDPEGYLLEFEVFKQHPENEPAMPLLQRAPDLPVSPTVANAPGGLAFHGTVAWLYYQDVLAMENFVEQTLGFPLVIDQGWAKVYPASQTGFIGLVDERRGMNDYTEEKAVNVSFWMDDLDGWWGYAKKEQPFSLRQEELTEDAEGRYRAFVGFDPEGYFLEFDQFLDHPANANLPVVE